VENALDNSSVTVFSFDASTKTFRAIEASEITSTMENENIAALALSLNAPNSTNAKSVFEFVKQNPSVLMIEVGRLTQAGLCESSLAANTDDIKILREWKKVAAELRKITQTGAEVVTPSTGDRRLSKSHRFSYGAQVAHMNGVQILPLAGCTRFYLPPPKLQPPSN
jgi:hypothetical protein